MQKLDLKFFHFLRKYKVSQGVDKFLKFYTRLGDGYVWALIVGIICFVYGWSVMQNILLQVIPTLLVSLALYWAVKLSVRRKRPHEMLKSVHADVPPLDKFSFPSGHTMNNLAVAFTVFATVPHIGWIMLLVPLTWGLLRVYYGVHWLSDVIGGVFLGFLSYYFGQIIFSIFT